MSYFARNLLSFIGLGISFLLLSTCGQSSDATAAKVPFRVSLQPIPSYAPLWVAKEKGWLEQDLPPLGASGVEWAVILDGPLQNEAFAGGRIDVALTGDTPAIVGRSAGLDTRIISVASFSPKSLAILVPSDSPIKTVADLKGKKVGATKGSFCHHLLALALAKANLGIGDVQFINLAAPDINTSLTLKEIDAGCTWEPYISQLKASKAARVLVDGTGIKRGDEVMVALAPFAAAHPEWISALLKGYARGAAFIKEHPADAAALIAGDVKLTPDQVQAAFAKTDYTPGVRPEDRQEFAESAIFLGKLGITQGPVDITAFVDDSYLQRAGLAGK